MFEAMVVYVCVPHCVLYIWAEVWVQLYLCKSWLIFCVHCTPQIKVPLIKGLSTCHIIALGHSMFKAMVVYVRLPHCVLYIGAQVWVQLYLCKCRLIFCDHCTPQIKAPLVKGYSLHVIS